MSNIGTNQLLDTCLNDFVHRQISMKKVTAMLLENGGASKRWLHEVDGYNRAITHVVEDLQFRLNPDGTEIIDTYKELLVKADLDEIADVLDSPDN